MCFFIRDHKEVQFNTKPIVKQLVFAWGCAEFFVEKDMIRDISPTEINSMESHLD